MSNFRFSFGETFRKTDGTHIEPAPQRPTQGSPVRVGTLTSLGAKLFYYMTALVLITVGGNSFQHIKSFLDHETGQVEDTLQSETERSANQIEDKFETWKSNIAVALPSFSGNDPARLPLLLKNFVASNPDFVHFSWLEAPSRRSTKFKVIGKAFTPRTKDQRFEDKVPDQIAKRVERANLRWLKRQAPRVKGEEPVIVTSLGRETQLPLAAMAVRFDIKDSSKVFWAVLTVWQSPLIGLLPKSAFVSSVMVDTTTGNTFASHDVKDIYSEKRQNDSVLGRLARNAASPSGFQKEYVGTDNHRKVGAYARLNKYPLTVLVERNAEQAYAVVNEMLLSTGLWATLFILLAVGFAYLGATGITRGLRMVTFATERIAAGDFQFRLRPRSRDEVGVLSVAVNSMSERIVQLLRSQVDKARFEKELETAKMVQSTFFPKQDIRSGDLAVTGFYQPASECGGDLWGHFSLGDGLDLVYIADATGHGAPSALVTAIAYSTAMTVADIVKEGAQGHDSPAALLERLNRIIHAAVGGKICMTCFACLIDTKRGVLTYANAGHNFPILLPAKGNDERAGKVPKSLAKLSDIQPVSLQLKGTPLGMDPSSTYKEKTLSLKPGDKIFFFTDGLIECQSPEGEVWGRKILLEHVVEAAKQPGEDLKREILSRAFAFYGNRPLDDDVTVVVAEVAKTWKPMAEPAPQRTSPASAPAAPTAAAAPAQAPAHRAAPAEPAARAPTPQTASQAAPRAPQQAQAAQQPTRPAPQARPAPQPSRGIPVQKIAYAVQEEVSTPNRQVTVEVQKPAPQQTQQDTTSGGARTRRGKIKLPSAG